jgi:toxin ParE1/3/4
MVKINWTEVSRDDLKEIFDYIARDSKKYAAITINKIYQKTGELKQNSSIGRIVPEFNDPKIRELLQGNYRIVYLVLSTSQIDILRIYHSARLLGNDSLPTQNNT